MATLTYPPAIKHLTQPIAWRRVGLLALLFGAGILIRLLVIGSVSAGGDIVNFEESALYVAHGLNLFEFQNAYNYSPVWAYILAPLTRLPIPFATSFRLLTSLLNFICALCIGVIARKQGIERWHWSVAIYWLNPFTILLDGWVGGFDQLALIPVLLMALLPRRREGALFSLGALALLFKHIVVFQVWTLFIYRWGTWKGSLRFGCAVAIFVLSFAPFVQTGWYYIVWNVFFYAAPWEAWGLQYIIPRSINTILFYSTMIALPFITKRLKLPLLDALFLSATLFFVVTYGFSYPTLIIPLAWACIRPSAWLLLPTVVMTLRIVPGVTLPPPATLIVWCSLAVASALLLSRRLSIKTC